MGLKLNPLTAQFDLVGSGGGGGASYIDGEVAVYADLPLSSTTAPLNTAWLVRGSSGIWPFTKPGGVYVRTATGGSSRDADYTYAGIFPDVFSDANFTLYDSGDSTKTAQFQLSSIATGQTRTISVPDKNITLDDSGDARTPTSHTHGNITNAGAIGSTSGLPVVTTTSGAITTLALGSAGQVLKVNSGGTAVEFGANAGGVSAVDSTTADVFSVSGSNLVADDANEDKIVAWDESASKLVYFDIDEIEKQPNQIDDCVVWLRSDDVVTDVRSSVTYVTTMNNKVNSSLNAVQTGDTTKQPTLSTNQINGHSAVVWDGSNDCLQIASLDLRAQITLFLVCKPDGSGASFFVEHSADSNNNDGFYFSGSGGQAAQVRRTGAQTYAGRTLWSGSSWNIFSLKTQGPPANWTIRRGKIGEEAGSATTSAPSNTVATTTLNIGARNNGASGAEAQQVAELIIFNRVIDDVEYAHIYKYLSNRYAL